MFAWKLNMEGLFNILDLAKENLILGFDHSGDKFVDVGKPESIVVAEELFL